MIMIIVSSGEVDCYPTNAGQLSTVACYFSHLMKIMIIKSVSLPFITWGLNWMRFYNCVSKRDTLRSHHLNHARVKSQSPNVFLKWSHLQKSKSMHLLLGMYLNNIHSHRLLKRTAHFHSFHYIIFLLFPSQFISCVCQSHFLPCINEPIHSQLKWNGDTDSESYIYPF